ncbi:hypothetical protein [Roseomonas sp. BN140053]|uniref:hypothetical protein n=1 Tax=Roseomonas sp. BN140053 TaxID=3391898 RepID=UPI0039E77D1F
MPLDKPDPMTSPDRDKPGNHPVARPGQEPDPRAQQPERRPGEPGIQGGPAGAGSTSDTGGSRG